MKEQTEQKERPVDFITQQICLAMERTSLVPRVVVDNEHRDDQAVTWHFGKTTLQKTMGGFFMTLERGRKVSEQHAVVNLSTFANVFDTYVNLLAVSKVWGVDDLEVSHRVNAERAIIIARAYKMARKALLEFKMSPVVIKEAFDLFLKSSSNEELLKIENLLQERIFDPRNDE